MKRYLLVAIFLIIAALSMMMAAYQLRASHPRQVIDVEKLGDNLYVLTSSAPGDDATFSGGNVAVLITDTGVTLIDTKRSGWGRTFLNTLKTVTTKPVTRIINTHSHGDHTGNDDKFGAAVEIVAQENTKGNMERLDYFKGDKARFVPKKVFQDQLTVGTGKDRIDLYYFGAGHTNGDAFVVFPALRVLHTGDMFAGKAAPACDRANGGSCIALPQTLAKVVATIKDVDTVIPGHSPMMTPEDLRDYQRFTADLVAHAQAANKAGQSVDEASAAFTMDKYPGYNNERIKNTIQTVYDEIKP